MANYSNPSNAAQTGQPSASSNGSPAANLPMGRTDGKSGRVMGSENICESVDAKPVAQPADGTAIPTPCEAPAESGPASSKVPVQFAPAPTIPDTVPISGHTESHCQPNMTFTVMGVKMSAQDFVARDRQHACEQFVKVHNELPAIVAQGENVWRVTGKYHDCFITGKLHDRFIFVNQ